MLKDYKRKKIALCLALISLSIIVIAFMLPGSGLYYNNKIIALVNNERIYSNDIKDELAEMFPGSNPKTFQVERLPQNVLELISKAVFIKRQIYKEARNKMIHKDKKIKSKISKYSKKTIREHYIDLQVHKNVTREEIRAKYLELTDKAKGDGEIQISHILVKTQYQANKVIERVGKGRSFSSLAQRYSLDKRTSRKSGAIGYFKQEDIPKEFVQTLSSMREGDLSDPIKTKRGWHVLKLSAIRIPQLEEFNIIEDKISRDLRAKAIDKIFSDISKNAKVKILIDNP